MNKTFADFGIDIPFNPRPDADGNIRTLCPKCSHTRHKSTDPCLSVNIEKGVWHCWHCDYTGGIGETQEEVARARKVFVKPHFVESEIKDPRVLKWFADRRIHQAALSAFKIKTETASFRNAKGDYENVVAMLFPYYFHGEVVNIKYRTSDKRFRQAKDGKKVLYNFDAAFADVKRMEKPSLIITEGEMDVLACYEAGFQNATSVPDGAPSPDTKNYTSKFDYLANCEELLKSCECFILAVDNDAPGIKLRDELARRLGIEKCKRVVWPDGCKDANDVLKQYGPERLNLCLHQATEFPIKGVKSARDLQQALFELHETQEVAGVQIGWRQSEEYLNIEPGQMTVVTGIPSHGKSTFIDALRMNLFKNHGWKSAAFSPENWPVQNHYALLTEMFESQNFREIPLERLHEISEILADSLFFITPDSDEDMMTVDAILESARALIFRHGIKALVIDPWNEIEHKIPSGQREDLYISEQLAKIRRFARMNAIHIFLIVHPHMLQKDKDGKYPAPTAYDIAGGAMWYNKADNILCVFRPDMNTSETKVIIQKIRFRRNGKKGIMTFSFNVRTSTYFEPMQNDAI